MPLTIVATFQRHTVTLDTYSRSCLTWASYFHYRITVSRITWHYVLPTHVRFLGNPINSRTIWPSTDWVILGIWWFIFQQPRPGPKIPKGSSYTTIGFKQIWLAIREIRSLPQTFLYFFAYFLLADGLNTTGRFFLIDLLQIRLATPTLIDVDRKIC